MTGGQAVAAPGAGALAGQATRGQPGQQAQGSMTRATPPPPHYLPTYHIEHEHGQQGRRGHATLPGNRAQGEQGQGSRAAWQGEQGRSGSKARGRQATDRPRSEGPAAAAMPLLHIPAPCACSPLARVMLPWAWLAGP